MVGGKQKEPHLQETGVCCSFRPMENTSMGPGGWFSSCSAAGSSSPLVKITISSAVRGTTMVSSAQASSAGAPLCWASLRASLWVSLLVSAVVGPQFLHHHHRVRLECTADYRCPLYLGLPPPPPPHCLNRLCCCHRKQFCSEHSDVQVVLSHL